MKGYHRPIFPAMQAVKWALSTTYPHGMAHSAGPPYTSIVGWAGWIRAFKLQRTKVHLLVGLFNCPFDRLRLDHCLWFMSIWVVLKFPHVLEYDHDSYCWVVVLVVYGVWFKKYTFVSWWPCCLVSRPNIIHVNWLWFLMTSRVPVDYCCLVSKPIIIAIHVNWLWFLMKSRVPVDHCCLMSKPIIITIHVNWLWFLLTSRVPVDHCCLMSKPIIITIHVNWLWFLMTSRVPVDYCCLVSKPIIIVIHENWLCFLMTLQIYW